jgi:hypothetical protein
LIERYYELRFEMESLQSETSKSIGAFLQDDKISNFLATIETSKPSSVPLMNQTSQNNEITTYSQLNSALLAKWKSNLFYNFSNHSGIRTSLVQRPAFRNRLKS